MQVPSRAVQVRSGTDAKKDSYSAFGAKEPESGKSLLEVLQDRAARRVFVLGLATDYVVKAGSSSITVHCPLTPTTVTIKPITLKKKN